MSARRAAVEAWWRSTDDASRDRVLRLGPHDPLPADLAVEMVLRGVAVTSHGMPTSCDDEPLFIQPDALTHFLDEYRRRQR